MAVAMRGDGLQVVRRDLWVPERLERARREWSPKTDLGRFIRLASDELARIGKWDEAAELIERFSRVVVIGSKLFGVAFIWNERLGIRETLDYGLLSEKLITTVGVGFLVDAWQNSVELENMKYHGIGTGVGAEAAGDTALGTELTTEYNPNSTRATGTTTEGGSANIFRSVGTNTLDSGTPAVTEHGLFSANAAGVLWDRSVFAAINLVGANADGIQHTYDATASAGG